MNRSDDRIKELIELQLEGKLTGVGQAELWDYVDDPIYTDKIKEVLGRAFESQPIGESLTEVQKNHVLSDVLEIPATIETKKVSLWPRWVAAAAVAAVVFGAGLFYYTQHTKQTIPTEIAAQEDVAPGKQGATLTLANGRKIRLSDAKNGELANEAGVSITKTAEGELVYEIKNTSGGEGQVNHISTANGETYRLRLPDGSTVWLNAASSLTYSASLIERGKRRVMLIGEAYFEVAKDKAHPFIVNTHMQEVAVLGTQFNVSSYQQDMKVSTTLIEGSVQVTTVSQGELGAGQKGKREVLKPGEQAISKGNGLSIREVDTEEAVSWKAGYFVFDKTSLESILRQVERWYDVEVVYEDEGARELTFSGSASRYENVSRILKTLSYTGVVKFKIAGRKIYVSK